MRVVAPARAMNALYIPQKDNIFSDLSKNRASRFLNKDYYKIDCDIIL